MNKACRELEICYRGRVMISFELLRSESYILVFTECVCMCECVCACAQWELPSLTPARERGDEQTADNRDSRDNGDSDHAIPRDLVLDDIHERYGLPAVRRDLEKLVEALATGHDIIESVVTQCHVVQTVAIGVSVLQQSLHHNHTFSYVCSLRAEPCLTMSNKEKRSIGESAREPGACSTNGQ